MPKKKTQGGSLDQTVNEGLVALGFKMILWFGSPLWIHPDTQHWVQIKEGKYELSKPKKNELDGYDVLCRYTEDRVVEGVGNAIRLCFRKPPEATQAVAQVPGRERVG